MEETFYELVIIIMTLLTLAVLSSFYWIGWFLGRLRNKVKQFVEQKNTEILNEETKKSLKQANLIKEREEKLGWITKAVAIIELVVFGGLAWLIIIENLSVLEGAKVFGTFLGGWLGIKVLSSHGVWSDPVVGKAYYHISLFGTLLNVTVGFLAVLFIHYFAQCAVKLP